jgi:hypothetical protein
MIAPTAQTGRRYGLRATALLLAVVIAAMGALAAGADAKKKKSKAKNFSAQVTVNQTIPDAVTGAVSTPLTSTINVPKKFKGKVVGDVNVTRLQTTGSDPGTANDLTATLVAPSGRSTDLFAFIGAGSPSLGPMTIDDSGAAICNSSSDPCLNGFQTLYPPFAGAANTTFSFAGIFPTNGPLATFDGVRMNGIWTLVVSDQSSGGPDDGTSVLNQWGLQISAAKPPKA